MHYFNFLKERNINDRKTWLHGLHPVIKFSLMILLFIIIYSIDSYVIKLLFTCGLFILIGYLSRSIKVLLYLLLTISIFTLSYLIMFFILGIDHILVSGIEVMINVSIFILPFIVYNIITSFDETVYALEKILYPLNIFKLPINDFILVIGITLNFLPIAIIEMDRILFMQSMRQRDLKTANIFMKIRILISVLTPLLYSFIIQSNMLAASIELRGYDSKLQRTSIRKYTLINN